MRNILKIKWKNLLFSGKILWMYWILTSNSTFFFCDCLLMTAVLPSSWGPLCWWRSCSGWSTQTEWTPQTSISCTGKTACPAACSVWEVWRWWQSRYKLAVDEIKAHLSQHEVLKKVLKWMSTSTQPLITLIFPCLIIRTALVFPELSKSNEWKVVNEWMLEDKHQTSCTNQDIQQFNI